MANRCLICLFFLSFISCDHVYKKWEREPFAGYRWGAKTEVTFHPTIKDITKKYELVIGIRHVAGMPVSNIPVIVRIISPAGKEVIKQYYLQVLTPEGKPLAKCAGDICDLETSVGEIVFVEPGDYQLIVLHKARGGTLVGIMEVGVILNEMD